MCGVATRVRGYVRQSWPAGLLLASQDSILLSPLERDLLLTVGAGCAHPAPLPPGQSLLELVANEMAADAARDSEALQAFYERTLDHIRQKKAAGGDAAAKYDALQV